MKPILSGKAALDYLRGKAGRDGLRLPILSAPVDDDEVFYCEESDEVTGKCPIYSGSPTLKISHSLLGSLIELASRSENEWLAYMVGRWSVRRGRGVVSSVYFPPQEVSPYHAEPDSHFRTRRGTIGVVHSHVDMAASFSGTDIKHMNWPVEAVLNRSGEYQLMVRVRLRCGEVSRTEATFDDSSRRCGRLLAELRAVERVAPVKEMVRVNDLTEEERIRLDQGDFDFPT